MELYLANYINKCDIQLIEITMLIFLPFVFGLFLGIHCQKEREKPKSDKNRMDRP